jgi:predicted secreted Zn-dependent protease
MLYALLSRVTFLTPAGFRQVKIYASKLPEDTMLTHGFCFRALHCLRTYCLSYRALRCLRTYCLSYRALRCLRTGKALVVSLFVLLACNVQADVQEDIDYDYYRVDHYSGEGLKDAMTEATPYFEDGERMHGNTKWDIRWNFRYGNNGGGDCRITEVDVDLTIVVGLPQLSTHDRRARERFDRYMVNLNRHEQTHVRIARDGAYQIDRALLSMRAEPNCDQLERRANQTANRLVNDVKRAQRQYDKRTDHGRTEGAWLDY